MSKNRLWQWIGLGIPLIDNPNFCYVIKHRKDYIWGELIVKNVSCINYSQFILSNWEHHTCVWLNTIIIVYIHNLEYMFKWNNVRWLMLCALGKCFEQMPNKKYPGKWLTVYDLETHFSVGYSRIEKVLSVRQSATLFWFDFLVE